MPELPEVETLCRQLNTLLPGKTILRIEVLDSRLGKIEELVGRRIESVIRRGKCMQILMNSGLTAALHLRMSGRLLWQEGGDPLLSDALGPENGEPLSPGSHCRGGDALPLLSGKIGSCSPFFPHCRLVIAFSSGTLLLIDPRRFATFTVRPAESIPALVEDPLVGISARRLREIARTRRRPVKSLLMDQRLIAGIGNIYACEILFATGIDPRRSASGLSPAEWRKVAKATVAILDRAVACRGTTVSDWRDLFGCSGTNQDHLAVYARQGEPCRRCGGRIERITQDGRGTWLCPACQQ